MKEDLVCKKINKTNDTFNTLCNGLIYPFIHFYPVLFETCCLQEPEDGKGYSFVRKIRWMRESYKCRKEIEQFWRRDREESKNKGGRSSRGCEHILYLYKCTVALKFIFICCII